MTTIRQQFSDNFTEDIFGRITGTFLLSRFPNIHGRLFRLKADPGNAGTIWIGTSMATGMFPLPFPLEPGADTGWCPLNSSDDIDPVGNLNQFYQNASSGSSYVSYWVMG